MPAAASASASASKRAFCLLLLALAGCGRCSRSSSDPDGGPPAPPPPPPELLPAPSPLTFAPVRGRTSVAIPQHCKLRSPITEAKLSPSARFLAEPRSLGALLVAEAQGDPPVLSAVSALTLDPNGPSRDPRPLPWPDDGSVTSFALARADGSPEGILAAIESAGDAGATRVDLWRSGVVDPIGEGDRFHAVDLACDQGRCALLTTRMGKVAAAGAEVRVGAAGESAASWQRVEIIPSQGGSDAQPLALARVAVPSAPGAPPTPGVVAALMEKGSSAFFSAGEPGGPREIARIHAPYGVLDVLAAPDPIAMTYGSPVDENGCSVRGAVPPDSERVEEDEEDSGADEGDENGTGSAPAQAPELSPGAWIRIERAAAPGVDIRVPSPPVSGALRRLSEGALAVWIAPLGCGFARHVVYAVVLDASGAPVGSPIPVADGERFAAASSKDAVDLWLQREQALTWIPLTCAPPKAP